jgi:N6-L-threonylcarbamoyladenine synthase
MESSCDETAAAVVDSGLVISSVIRSQTEFHLKYGGVVPEIASRAHLEAVDSVVKEAIAQSGLELQKIEAIAVTQGPGLVGALLVALSYAKGLSIASNIKVVGVNHVQAHALSPFLSFSDFRAPDPDFPLVALVVSGGHTSLFLVKSETEFKTIGQTVDDAAGEAFDKCAKLMGLGYPGGPAIDKMARGGDAKAFNITRPMWRKGLNFSFSGLKTRVHDIYHQNSMDNLPDDAQALKDLAASLQEAIVDVLADKLYQAASFYEVKSVVLAGGVAANSRLRQVVIDRLASSGLNVLISDPAWCTDNAAMIAYLGGFQIAKNIGILDLNAEPKPRWPVDQ